MTNRRDFLAKMTVIAAAGIDKQMMAAELVMPSAKTVESHHLTLHSIENPVGASPKVQEIIAKIPPLYHRYGMQEVLEGQLRARLSDELQVAGKNIFFGGGSYDLLRMLVQQLASKSRPMVLSHNEFGFMRMFARDYAVGLKTLPLTAHLQPDLEALARAAKHAGMVYLSNPHLPIGKHFEPEKLKKFIARCAPTPVVIDECYLHFLGKNYSASSIAAAVNTHRNLIVVRTFSKFYALAGLRVGVLVAAPEIQARLDLKTRQVCPLAVAAAMIAIDDKTHHQRVRDHYKQVRQKLVQFCKNNGVSYVADVDVPFFVFLRDTVSPAVQESFLQNYIGFYPLQHTGKGKAYYSMVTIARLAEIDAHLRGFATALKKVGKGN